MWETAERAGLTTANLMWYVWNVPRKQDNENLNFVLQARPTNYIHWRKAYLLRPMEGMSIRPYDIFVTVKSVLQDKVSLKWKHDQIMSWIDLPLERRPQFIMGTYDQRAVELILTSQPQFSVRTFS